MDIPADPVDAKAVSQTVKVSSKRSLSYHMTEATKALGVYDQVEVSGLGSAIPTVVTIVEILKSSGFCDVKSVSTSLSNVTDRRMQKPKIEVIIVKAETFEKVRSQKAQLAEENAEIYQTLNQAQRAMQEQLKEDAKSLEPKPKTVEAK